VCDQKSMHVTFRLCFVQDMLKLEILTFARLCGNVLKVLYGYFVGNLLFFQQWKNFENPLRIDEFGALLFYDTV